MHRSGMGSSWFARGLRSTRPGPLSARLRAARAERMGWIASRAPLVEMRRVSERPDSAVMGGKAVGVERGGTELAPLVHRIEIQIEGRTSVLEQPGKCQPHYPLQGFETGIGRPESPAHAFDSQEAATNHDVRLTSTG